METHCDLGGRPLVVPAWVVNRDPRMPSRTCGRRSGAARIGLVLGSRSTAQWRDTGPVARGGQ
jgi:hypothetical protein